MNKPSNYEQVATLKQRLATVLGLLFLQSLFS